MALVDVDADLAHVGEVPRGLDSMADVRQGSRSPMLFQIGEGFIQFGSRGVIEVGQPLGHLRVPGQWHCLTQYRLKSISSPVDTSHHGRGL